MKTRILSGIIMLPLLAFVYLGGRLLLLGCFLLAVTAISEFYKGFNNINIKPSLPIGLAFVFLLYSINLINYNSSYIMLWFFLAILASFLYLFKINSRKLEDGMAILLGIIYIGFFSYHIVLVEQTGEYGILVWLIFISGMGTDVFAYFTGYFIGKHKLAENISPKKTIEGSIGGILGSLALSGIFAYYIVPSLFLHCMIIGFLGSIVSQLGDLTASIFKRKMGIKDYGNIIPGHGGALDRIDSILFSAPLIYYYITIIL